MSIKYTRLYAVFILLLVSGGVLMAQSSENNPITTAVPFLRLSADARAAGMGDAVVAVNPDANSSFYNGAKTAFNTKNFGIGVTYTPWLKGLNIDDIYQLSAAGYYKLDDMQAISVGVRSFSKGTFVLRDGQEQQLKTFKPMDVAVEAGYSRKLSDNMGLGLNLRYINSNLADNVNNSGYKNGSAVAADLSFFYTRPSGWNFGATLSNLGSKMDYGGRKNFIPANLALGTAYNLTIDENSKINFALDVSKLLVPTPPDPTDADAVNKYEDKGVVSSWFSSFGDAPGGFKEELREVQVAFGTEYSYKEIFDLRAGYFSESSYKGNRKYLTLGAGLGFDRAKVNFGYLLNTNKNPTLNPLQYTFRFSVIFMAKN